MNITPRDTTGTAEPKALAAALDKQPAKGEGAPLTPEATPAPAKSEDFLSPKFAALARQQKLIREEQRRFQAEKAAFKAEAEELAKVKGWQDRLKQNPLEVLTEAGLSYDQLTQSMLSQPDQGDPLTQKLQRDLLALQKKQDEAAESIKKEAEDRRNAALNQIRNDVKILVSSNEDFETIKSEGAEDAVVELIEQTYMKDKMLMKVDAAAKEVEEYLIENALRVARLKKVQSRLNPTPAVPDPALTPEPQKQALPSQKPQPTTLSNRMATTSKPLTWAERRARAIAIAEGRQI